MSRSVKKCERRSNGELIMVLSLTFTMGFDSSTALAPLLPAENKESVKAKSFEETVVLGKLRLHFYTRDNALDAFLEADLSKMVQAIANVKDPMHCMQITLEDYQSL